MNTKLKWIVAAAVIAAGGFYAGSLQAATGHTPGDLRDAPSGGALDTLKGEAGASDSSLPEPKAQAANTDSGAAANSAFTDKAAAGDLRGGHGTHPGGPSYPVRIDCESWYNESATVAVYYASFTCPEDHLPGHRICRFVNSQQQYLGEWLERGCIKMGGGGTGYCEVNCNNSGNRSGSAGVLAGKTVPAAAPAVGEAKAASSVDGDKVPPKKEICEYIMNTRVHDINSDKGNPPAVCLQGQFHLSPGQVTFTGRLPPSGSDERCALRLADGKITGGGCADSGGKQAAITRSGDTARGNSGSCAWDQVFNVARCCPAGQQATWDPVFKTVSCNTATAGGCVWDQVFSTTRCCPAGQEAFWDETFKTVRCVSPENGM